MKTRLSPERERQIIWEDSPLTADEVDSGWHFCPDCMYTLQHVDDGCDCDQPLDNSGVPYPNTNDEEY